MFVEPYLFFAGQCAHAMQRYQDVLGGELHIMRYADAPPDAQCGQMDAMQGQHVMHAILRFEQGALMASDMPPGQPYDGIQGMAVTLNFPDLARAQHAFTALAEGGSIQMPFAPTFWAEGFGMLRDRFGTPWMINGPLTAPSP